MNTETALAHIEAYIAGGDELGDVSDADALAALETLRNAITAAHPVVAAAQMWLVKYGADYAYDDSCNCGACGLIRSLQQYDAARGKEVMQVRYNQNLHKEAGIE